MRFLDRQKVACAAVFYDAAIYSAVGVAEAVGVAPQHVYKTT
jgi:hypothetical protein